MTTQSQLISRLEGAEGLDRGLDRALAFLGGIGTDLERAFSEGLPRPNLNTPHWMPPFVCAALRP